MLLDLEDLEMKPTNQIPGFYERIQQIIPSLYNHYCSENAPGGFFERVKDGTWMGHVVEHIAIELQSLAGMDLGFGRTRGAGREGVYHVVFSYCEEQEGIYTAKAAVRIADALVKGTQYDIKKDIEEIKRLWYKERLRPDINDLVTEAYKRQIPVTRLDSSDAIQLGYGARQKLIDATLDRDGYEAKKIVDRLFPGSDGRIPIVAITGTHGKTITTRLLAQMVQHAGFNTGYTTADGVYVNNVLINEGDAAGPYSAQLILKDTAVEFAVLACARGGLLRSGLAFDACECAVVTNLGGDGLGLDSTHTIEQLAKVKSVVPETVREGGYAILNADDDLVYAMKDNVKCEVGLCSLFPDCARIEQHCAGGGLAAFVDDGDILIRRGMDIIPVEEIRNIPITLGGSATSKIYYVLAAILAAYVNKINLNTISQTLRTFVPSIQTTRAE
ncbi:Mur ligase family protein [Chitinophagaceae bacterium LB-8]|uniref:Mur ligase family protein n=1 Tax=Paraflavisolibacter caeni TaxID=2982496 RepID=A0A9X2XVG3_9BACT|nr:Mur ligase family protein [Paraflavisolibacter caeni]MCU7550069.1 Mur ligase family protein [Paraflavisolibacter caeni]